MFTTTEYTLTGYTYLLVSDYSITNNFGFICISKESAGIQFTLFNRSSNAVSGTINARFVYYKN